MVKQYPKLNIIRFLERANTLVYVCKQDRVRLEQAGLAWSEAEHLITQLDTFTTMHTQWQFERERLDCERVQYKKAIDDARQLRGTLCRQIREACKLTGHHLPPHVKRSTWKNIDNLVGDLHTLAYFCTNSKTELETIRFDFTLAEEAQKQSQSLAATIAHFRLAVEKLDSKNVQRWELLTTLYEQMKRICVFGRRAFSDDPQLIQNYRKIH